MLKALLMGYFTNGEWIPRILAFLDEEQMEAYFVEEIVKNTNILLMYFCLFFVEERNFACDLCNKTFATNSKVAMHKKYVHIGELFISSLLCTSQVL